MNLEDLIIDILKNGKKLKATEIAKKASLLNSGEPYSKRDVNKTIFNTLRQIIKFDSLTYEYYISNETNSDPIISTVNKKDIHQLIKETLRKNSNPMTLIEICNFLKMKYTVKVNIEELQIIILTDLKYEIGIEDGKIIKYYLFQY